MTYILYTFADVKCRKVISCSHCPSELYATNEQKANKAKFDMQLLNINFAHLHLKLRSMQSFRTERDVFAQMQRLVASDPNIVIL